MSKRSVSKVSHYAPTTFSFGERVRAGQQKTPLTELWQMSVPRYQFETLEGESSEESVTDLDQTLAALRTGFQNRAERRKDKQKSL